MSPWRWLTCVWRFKSMTDNASLTVAHYHDEQTFNSLRISFLHFFYPRSRAFPARVKDWESGIGACVNVTSTGVSCFFPANFRAYLPRIITLDVSEIRLTTRVESRLAILQMADRCSLPFRGDTFASENTRWRRLFYNLKYGVQSTCLTNEEPSGKSVTVPRATTVCYILPNLCGIRRCQF